jgi:hypothetical protein
MALAYDDSLTPQRLGRHTDGCLYFGGGGVGAVFHDALLFWYAPHPHVPQTIHAPRHLATD